ncbi:MAG: 3-isopropylmalate dehydrogenase [Candidatus Eremiobacteraeota bacterium]|nr:3-isopropylmalate dehydrogenase [Candidatus Eremiobacteraeota bacterium]
MPAPLIAVLPGDGIGPEVVRAAVDVLRTVRPDCEYVPCEVGAGPLLASGKALPEETRAICERASAILFGAVGGLQFDGKPLEERPEWALLSMRREFELYANVRPVQVFPGLEHASSLKPDLVAGLDLIVLRELTGGVYYGQHRYERAPKRHAFDELKYDEDEVRRIARFGFELAANRRKKLTSVDKLNVIATSRLWREIVDEVAGEFPDVSVEHILVDAAAMHLVREPKRFDVIVTENMFGDILSDEAAMLTGSLGNLPSASIGTKTTPHGKFGLYEPISGTAPDIAGKGIANPTAAILSAALLCRYSLSDSESAARIERAVAHAFEDGVRTADIAGTGRPVSTAEFAAAVRASLGEAPIGV